MTQMTGTLNRQYPDEEGALENEYNQKPLE